MKGADESNELWRHSYLFPKNENQRQRWPIKKRSGPTFEDKLANLKFCQSVPEAKPLVSKIELENEIELITVTKVQFWVTKVAFTRVHNMGTRIQTMGTRMQAMGTRIQNVGTRIQNHRHLDKQTAC